MTNLKELGLSILKGDSAETVISSIMTMGASIVNARISTLDAERVGLAMKLQTAKENFNKAMINNAVPFGDDAMNDYPALILEAKKALDEITTQVEINQEKTKTFKTALDALG